ncbi:glycoside hydrolase family 45 protein [Mixia osmundae IAM 14324]|uniref:Expansin-like EG45 domain-containing protein n=1 Tax=Mixia osmundae (strain CBS 9802 / IAM 14324 / JCM 22182 / KY 12970) TaxID=764103 RepID=G7E1M2_MIXOS|nr:glycoside hydrolase family 45 protein [Mixia osmundae IAM 14324]KEI36682.1 glycoside hydrolase family 45 protein [Mixia osmundae IAM 14324]GAA96732.1 hypothetical protein E5Q_03403 [Mixia osmundae IAM 14324]
MADFGVKFDVRTSQGWFLPSKGTASTTQFALNGEVRADGTGGSTACGASAWGPIGAKYHTDGPGKGPGLLYAAINQEAFGSVHGSGPACGLCFELSPVSGSGQELADQALTFEIIDNCPVGSGSDQNCGQCKGTTNAAFSKPTHFDIASDAMSPEQYAQFYNGVTDGSNWRSINFKNVPCNPDTNPKFATLSWGCNGSCKSENIDSCVDINTGRSVEGMPASSGIHRRMTPFPSSAFHYHGRRRHAGH